MAHDDDDDGDDDEEASWIYVLPEFDLYLMDAYQLSSAIIRWNFND